MSSDRPIWQSIKPLVRFIGVSIASLAFVVGGCFAKGQLKKNRLLKEGRPIVAAIKAFHKEKGRFPETLAELHLPPSSIDPGWRYFSNPYGRFQIQAYFGIGRATILYRTEPGNPGMTGWFTAPEASPNEWKRLVPSEP